MSARVGRSCSRRAWATGAPFRFVKAMLGLDAHDGVIDLDPHVPAKIGRVYIHRLHAFATDRDVEATGKNGSAGLAS
jgi:hypothetical protein